MMFSDQQMIVLGIVGAGALVYLGKKTAAATDIRSGDNLAAQFVEQVGDTLDNGKADNSFNLGREIFYFLNPDEKRVEIAPRQATVLW